MYVRTNYSRLTLSDTFLALKSCVTKGKCVTQGMSLRFRDIPWVPHIPQNCVIKGKFNAIFPLVTHFSAQTCVTKGKIALNFPLVTQFWETCVTQGMSRNITDIPWVTHFPLVTHLFSAKKCVTQGMSTVLRQIQRSTSMKIYSYRKFSLSYNKSKTSCRARNQKGKSTVDFLSKILETYNLSN